jgi:UDP-2-acetamido-3-amino-2,3-dideoxy-glucuronate N-acetyltransferase
MTPASIHETADVSPDATVGDGTSIWHLVQVREGARIGEDCVIGRAAYIGAGVEIGERTKVQNFALVYEPARLGRGVFIGPAVVLTNDVYPRSVDADLQLKRGDDWDAVGVVVGDGASIGARSVVLAGVEIGTWALVGAGSTVIRDVPAHALVVGNPAVQKGWVGRTGKRMSQDASGLYTCPDTGDRFSEADGVLRLLD